MKRARGDGVGLNDPCVCVSLSRPASPPPARLMFKRINFLYILVASAELFSDLSSLRAAFSLCIYSLRFYMFGISSAALDF